MIITYKNYNATTLPSNLKPTTRECVHLVTRGHLWSRDKYGGHTIWYAIAGKPHAICKLHGSMLYKSGVMADQSSTLREWGFSTFFISVTFT